MITTWIQKLQCLVHKILKCCCSFFIIMVYHWPFTVKAGYTSPFFWLFQRKKTHASFAVFNKLWVGFIRPIGLSMKLYSHFILPKAHLTSLCVVCMFKLSDLCSVLFVCTAVNYLSPRLDLSTNKYNKY